MYSSPTNFHAKCSNLSSFFCGGEIALCPMTAGNCCLCRKVAQSFLLSWPPPRLPLLLCLLTGSSQVPFPLQFSDILINEGFLRKSSLMQTNSQKPPLNLVKQSCLSALTWQKPPQDTAICPSPVEGGAMLAQQKWPTVLNISGACSLLSLRTCLFIDLPQQPEIPQWLLLHSQCKSWKISLMLFFTDCSWMWIRFSLLCTHQQLYFKPFISVVK